MKRFIWSFCVQFPKFFFAGTDFSLDVVWFHEAGWHSTSRSVHLSAISQATMVKGSRLAFSFLFQCLIGEYLKNVFRFCKRFLPFRFRMEFVKKPLCQCVLLYLWEVFCSFKCLGEQCGHAVFPLSAGAFQRNGL